MTQKPRIDRLQNRARAHWQARRDQYKAFWAKFSTRELELISKGDEAAIARCVAMGGEKISRLAPGCLTESEKRLLSEIVAKLEQENKD
ncbi:MAG: hypothetical protein JW987_13425 [Anaerolineaceae bacterium]|nr:hypothetical protein [Anaerolineaceae bacterium]